MRRLKLVTHCAILATMPSMLVDSRQSLPYVAFEWVNDRNQEGPRQLGLQTASLLEDSHWRIQREEEWIRPNTYDEILQMLEDLDSGELEKRYSPSQLERINDYIVTLAKEGAFPNEWEEGAELEEDAYDLMYGEDSVIQLTRSVAGIDQYGVMPAIFKDDPRGHFLPCGKIGSGWKKTKKFVKKHKKAIIIGAIIVVVVTVVVVAVVVTSSASVASAAAGAAAAAGALATNEEGLDFDDSEPQQLVAHQEEDSILSPDTAFPVDSNKTPLIQEVLEEHLDFLKESLVEDSEGNGRKGWDDLSFSEKARELGAVVAHKAFDEVTDLVKVVPMLCGEIKDLSEKFLPENIGNEEQGKGPLENYESFVSKGHEVIDEVFSTDQAEFFTPEARANDPMNQFALGFLPPPGAFGGAALNTDKLAETGKAIDRAGFTKAGRGLMKHGYREGSAFPKPTGNPAQINEQGQKILESILNHSEKKVVYKNTSNFGEVIDVYAPGIGGARFNSSGEMIGFLEL